MNTDIYRFKFDGAVDLTEAEHTMHLAVIVMQCLYGEALTRAMLRYYLDTETRTFVVDARHRVGIDLVRVLAGLYAREFGERAVGVSSVGDGADEPTHREAA